MQNLFPQILVWFCGLISTSRIAFVEGPPLDVPDLINGVLNPSEESIVVFDCQQEAIIAEILAQMTGLNITETKSTSTSSNAVSTGDLSSSSSTRATSTTKTPSKASSAATTSTASSAATALTRVSTEELCINSIIESCEIQQSTAPTTVAFEGAEEPTGQPSGATITPTGHRVERSTSRAASTSSLSPSTSSTLVSKGENIMTAANHHLSTGEFQTSTSETSQHARDTSISTSEMAMTTSSTLSLKGISATETVISQPNSMQLLFCPVLRY